MKTTTGPRSPRYAMTAMVRTYSTKKIQTSVCTVSISFSAMSRFKTGAPGYAAVG